MYTQQPSSTSQLRNRPHSPRPPRLRPCSYPDPARHPTVRDLHLVENPDLDVNKSRDPHRAICTTEHIGLHHQTGHTMIREKLCFQKFQQATQKAVAIKDSYANTKAYDAIFHGPFVVGVKALRMLLEAWDPSLYNHMLEISEHMPSNLHFKPATTGTNPFHYCAFLVETVTEGHVDSTDMKNGLAGLMCFGNFTGGDLVLKELGARITFPPGSTCLLRGTENHHFIMPHQGSRSVFVLTGKEAVRADYLWFAEKIITIRHSAAANMTRKLTTLSILEQEARNMYTHDWTDQQIVDFLWNKIKEAEHKVHNPPGGIYTRRGSVDLSQVVL